jgi:hypothetical protein
VTTVIRATNGRLSEPQAKRVATVVVGASILLMAWHLLAPSEPARNVSWGVSYYTKLPWPFQVLGVLFFLGALLWALLTPGDTGTEPVQGHNSTVKASGWWRWLLVCIGMLLFAIAPVVYSEGDSGLFI